MIKANLVAGVRGSQAARVMSTNPARVELCGVDRTFGTHTVLHQVDIEIDPGEVVALLGSSGSGKSTLLRLVAGLDRPTEGRIVAVSGRSRANCLFEGSRISPDRQPEHRAHRCGAGDRSARRIGQTQRFCPRRS
jgi:ABC-type glutathione transport system ATPase component